MINCSCFKPHACEQIDSITIQRYCAPSPRLYPRAEIRRIYIYIITYIYIYISVCVWVCMYINVYKLWIILLVGNLLGGAAGESERMTQKTSVSKIATVFIGSRESPSFSIFLYSSGPKTQRPRGRFVVTNPKGNICIYRHYVEGT